MKFMMLKMIVIALFGSGSLIAEAEPAASKIGKFNNAMQSYCGACHSFGSHAFVTENTYSSLKKDETWISMIKATLSWPSDTPPRHIGGKITGNYMPAGGARYEIARDKIDGEVARKWLLTFIQSEL